MRNQARDLATSRSRRAAAALAIMGTLTPWPAAAMARLTPDDVALSFMTASGARERQAALRVLDRDVVIRFPSTQAAGGSGQAQGKSYVLGYMDGLVDSEPGARRVASTKPGVVRFQTYDRDGKPRRLIDIEVKNDHVVEVTVGLQLAGGE